MKETIRDGLIIVALFVICVSIGAAFSSVYWYAYHQIDTVYYCKSQQKACYKFKTTVPCFGSDVDSLTIIYSPNKY